MDDIFTWVREGNAFQVRMWLDNTENDLNQGDDHQFSLLHWAAREGRTNVCEMLINRGARINATNMGDDTALHLAAAHGHHDTVVLLLLSKANVNAINEHGNTPLHYACFWGYSEIAEHLVNNGALVGIANEFNKTPLEHTNQRLGRLLTERATELGQDTRRIPFQDRSWLGYQTRSRDATLSRHPGINFEHLHLTTRLVSGKSAEVWRGRWQRNDIVAKILCRVCSDRNQRDFNEEYPRLRIFNHPNILPVLGGCMDPKSRALVVVSQWMKFRTLYDVLHGETNIVVDQNQALRFALDIARGMEFLHSLEPLIPRMNLNSKHVMIDEDLAKINVDDPKYQMRSQNGGVVNGVNHSHHIMLH